ncbi:MAG TPA: pyruvate dehydrogenase complex E1 component subunit beta [Dehalococcoidia bacterium]|nr:pyruvate dehydrogenase complex E1 component subunit beta [Dehalococcoidia bacterium]
MTTDRALSFREAMTEALRLEMRRDPAVILMGEDVAGGAGRDAEGLSEAWGGAFAEYKGLYREFGPNRVLDTPISEMGYLGAAVGAAATGLRPVVELMFVDFIGVCLDQLMNQAAFLRYMSGGRASAPLTLITHIGAGVGMAAQHSKVLYSFFAHIPGLKVVAPSSARQAKGLLTAAIRDDDPVVFCVHKLLLGQSEPVPEEAFEEPIGRARLLREGRDVTLVGVALTARTCLDAAAALEADGVDAEVIDLQSLSPLDERTILESMAKTGRAVIVDEDFPRCGVAADVAALIAEKAFDHLDAPVRTVTAPHAPVPFSRPLEMAFIPSAARVRETALSLL